MKNLFKSTDFITGLFKGFLVGALIALMLTPFMNNTYELKNRMNETTRSINNLIKINKKITKHLVFVYNFIEKQDSINKSNNVIENKVLDHIKKYEGLRLNSYDDNGFLAIGYGHRLYGKQFNSITVKQADSMLYQDYKKRYNTIKKRYPHISDYKIHALACFIYNLGEGVLYKNNILHNAIINNKDDIVINQMIKYHNYNGNPHKKLKERRLFETTLYKS